MTDQPERTEAVERRGRWPGLVWAVPVAALLLVGYLGLRAFAERGVDVVVTFANSGGARVGDTKVIYQGVESGRVTKISINPDGKRVDMVLRLTPLAKPAMRAGTQFWLVGAKLSLTDVSSLKAAVSGVSIGSAPGSGPPTRRFDGLMSPPPVLPDTPGRAFSLTAERIGQIRADSGVFYHGLQVGKITTIKLHDARSFDVLIFLDAPYDRLVRPDSLFWVAAPFQVTLSGASVTAQLAPGSAPLAGGIEFDTSAKAATEPASDPPRPFVLYPDQGRAIAGGRGPQVAYHLDFRGPVGGLDEGAPVNLAGRQIGAVKDVGFALDPRTGQVSQPVTITIRPERLNLRGPTPPLNADWRPVTDAAMARLVARGYRVRLSQNPPLIGPSFVDLSLVRGARAAGLDHDSAETGLPTVASTDVTGLTDRASRILDKVDAVPIAEIGENVRRLTAKLDRLAGSPQVSSSLAHLNGTLTQVDQLMSEVRPQVGPLIGKLNTVADQLGQTAASANGVLSGEGARQDAGLPGAIRELTDAARSIRALTDYLGRHPEAVLRGKAKEHP